MKLSSFVLAFLAASLTSANPHFGPASISQWRPAGPTDYRGPCPMLNTLANHGFLPRDGRNITRNIIIDGLGSALNFNSSLASLMFDMAIIANPEPNATFFTLDQLNRHNVLEHDASLSRSDAYFGNNHVFNETIFEETLQYWTAPTLDTTMLANGKLARQINSKAFNPTYTFTQKTESFSLGEIGAPIVAFGDLKTGRVSRALVEYFFRNERFPIELGWSTRSEVVSLDDITQITNMVANAANLLTDSSSTKSASRRDLHAGLGF